MADDRPQFRVETDVAEGCTTLRLSGELDLSGVPVLRAVLASVEQDHALVLDCANLTFIDSSGLGCLVETRNSANAAGRDLRIVNLPVVPARTITMGGLAEFLGIEPQS